MLLDMLDQTGTVHNVRVHAASRVDGQWPTFDACDFVKALDRDDPLRRSYLQRRWHSQRGRTPRQPIASRDRNGEYSPRADPGWRSLL